MEANGWGYGPAAGGMPGQAPGMAMPAYGGGMASYQPAYNAGNVGLYNQQVRVSGRTHHGDGLHVRSGGGAG